MEPNLTSNTGVTPADEWVRIGREAHGKKEIEAAVNAYKQALRCDPHHIHALNNFAILLMQCDEQMQSLQTIEKAVYIRPDMWSVWATKARLECEIGMLEQAVLDARKSIELKSTLEGGMPLAMALRQLGKTREAVMLFDSMVDEYPQQPVAAYNAI